MRDGVEDALGLAPRVIGLIEQAETLLTRVGVVVDKIEATIDRADVLIGNVAATDQAARRVVASVLETAVQADSLFELYDEPLSTLAPSVRTFADALDPDEVRAMVGLVDRLPRLLQHLDEDVFPILTTLDRVAPDLHQLLEIAQDLQVALGGLPGMGWLRKRAEKEEQEAEEEEQEAEEEARAIEAATDKPRGKPKRPAAG